jgi:putative transcriptional regulator
MKMHAGIVAIVVFSTFREDVAGRIAPPVWPPMSALILKLPVPGRSLAERPKVDVRAVRRSLGLSKSALAVAFGVRTADLERWERNEGQPSGLAKMLFVIAEKEPEAVRRTLATMGLC